MTMMTRNHHSGDPGVPLHLVKMRISKAIDTDAPRRNERHIALHDASMLVQSRMVM